MGNKVKYFGTDGVRGEANVFPIIPEVALRMGRAAGRFFAREGHRPRIIIGKDTRISGYMLESALMSGICSVGGDVYLVGPMPTPAIAFITRSMRADAGIVISASHNPYYDNGIKLFGPEGTKLADSDESQLEVLMEEDIESPLSRNLGKAYRIDDAEGRYIVYAKATFPRGYMLDGLKIVVDCANGAGYRVAPDILVELGADVVMVGCSPDGLNINHQCGSTDLELLKKTVVEQQADVGIALDGDGDRAILCDSQGNTVDGDDILYVCARHLMSRDALAGNRVIGTVMTNVGLEAAFKDMGLELARVPVGDRYVMEEMSRSGAVLGGEQSGHVIFSDHSFTGDGVVTALQILGAMVESGKPLLDLTAGWNRYPQVMKNVRVTDRLVLNEQEWFSPMMETAAERLGSPHLLSVRYSGTEPLLRVTTSCAEADLTEEVASDIVEEVTRHIPVAE
jgi:phosphoglucosamine mutase